MAAHMEERLGCVEEQLVADTAVSGRRSVVEDEMHMHTDVLARLAEFAAQQRSIAMPLKSAVGTAVTRFRGPAQETCSAYPRAG